MFELPLSPMINQKDHVSIQNSPSPSTGQLGSSPKFFFFRFKESHGSLFRLLSGGSAERVFVKTSTRVDLGWIRKLTTTTGQKDAEKQHPTVTKENNRQAMCLQRNTCVMAVLILWRSVSCTHVQRLTLSFVFTADTLLTGF